MDHFIDRVDSFMRGSALPVAIFVRLHPLQTPVLPYGLIHNGRILSYRVTQNQHGGAFLRVAFSASFPVGDG